MIFAFLYLVVGSAVAYIMQSQISWLAEYITENWLLRPVVKILLDAWLGFAWVVAAPMLLIIVFHLKRVKNES